MEALELFDAVQFASGALSYSHLGSLHCDSQGEWGHVSSVGAIQFVSGALSYSHYVWDTISVLS